ncbi:hypothetical protein FHT40_003725 [Mycolicibacterium sp. BK556]|uniref:Rv1815 family serine proteinase n=1 Tax=Mycobacteriaceae TaxID=1762 RepID=UPI001061971E|nr:hypothetical protein [Mycobacterium sp. BK086]MBB3604064.1 hypothetical protein [Mycolicibacterium sp. BK556]MBB3634260.1 hypothetical protein [Mycolicibacterium sp. BK607]MBB3751840.1 hypothetical protein [Mycolicibacterium sp. BK634]
MSRFARKGFLATAAVLAASAIVAPAAHATPGVVVSPGMEIRQASNVCTLGYVDPAARIAYSAGHCRADGPVTNRDGQIIGTVSTSQDNTPDGAVVRTDQVISDYETITLAPDVVINNILPGGRQLVAEAAPAMAAGQPVCHFGVVTGESCGSIERVNNGWFTMENGVVSQKGDSGGPVYMPVDNNKAVIIGLFNSTWGTFPAAVSWVATSQQANAGIGVVNVAAAQETNAN